MNNREEKNGMLMLLLASIIWGLAYIVNLGAYNVIGVFTYNGLRSLIGALFLTPFVLAYYKKNKTLLNTVPELKEDDKKNYKGQLILLCISCGILNTISTLLQQFGLKMSSAGKAGFLTTLYTFFVPLISIFLGKKVSRKTIICALLSAFGVFLLCYSSGAKLSKGNAFVILSAVFSAIQMIIIGYYGRKFFSFSITAGMFLTAGIITSISSLFFETINFVTISKVISQILYAGILTTGVAFTLQVKGQKNVKPSKASLILSLESVWSAASGMMFLHEKMNGYELTGCVIMFTAAVLASISRNKQPNESSKSFA